MENNTSLAALLEPFQSGDVDGIEVAIRRKGDELELVVACRSSRGATFEHEGACSNGNCETTLQWMLEEAIARAVGTYKEQVRLSAASHHASEVRRSAAPSRASGDDGSEGAKKLSEREREVLRLVAEGDSNKKIAVKLGISVHTVNAHRVSIMHKLDIHDARGLTRFAMTHGLIEHPRR